MAATIRDACEDDLDAITALWQELLAVHHELDPLAWTVAPDGPEKIRGWYAEALGGEERLLLVAEDDGEVVGYVHGMMGAGPPPLAPRRAANVTDLAVRASHRRQGIGRRLMQAFTDRMAARGAVEVKLSVAVGNGPAAALYEALGFAPVTLAMRKVIA